LFTTRLHQLDLSKNIALEYLFCPYSKFTSLDLSNNSELKKLECYNSHALKELNVSSTFKLEELYCFATGLKELNVSNNKKLKKLHCYLTGLKELNVSSNFELEELVCHNAGLTELNVSNNSKLKKLVCYNNPALKELNISSKPEAAAIRYINCQHCNLAKIALVKLFDSLPNCGEAADGKIWITLNSDEESNYTGIAAEKGWTVNPPI